MVLMLVPIVGSVCPVPAPPVNDFPYAFAAYLWFGILRVMGMRHQKPERVEEISDGSQETSCCRNRLIMTATKIGAVASLHRYPVKSMMGEELNATRVGTKGFHGDRAFAIADAETGKIASAKNPSKWPTLFNFRAAFAGPLNGDSLPSVWITLPDGSTVSTEDKNIATRLSSSLGKPVRFLKGATASGTLEEYWPDIDGLAQRDVVTDEAMPAETFFDCATIHFLTTATLDSLRALYPEGQVETRRFRPNL